MKKHNELLSQLSMFAGQPRVAKALEVIIRAQKQHCRGKNPAMAFGEIKNPRLAVMAAARTLQFYTAAPQDSLTDDVKKASFISQVIGQPIKMRHGGNLFGVDSRVNLEQLVENIDDKLYEKRTAALASWVRKELDDARFWLKRVREKSDSYNIRYVNEHLAKAGCTPEWIGSSKRELAELLRQSYKISAAQWLGFMLRPNNSGDDHSRYIREDLAKGGWTLADIGSSEQELTRLVKASHKSRATYWLNSMRHPHEHSGEHSDWIRDHAAKAGCTLADIGTNEAELAELVRNYHKRQAQYWLKSTRKPSEHSSDYQADWVKEHAAKAGCTLADIGTNEAELAAFKRQCFKARAGRWLNWMRFPSDWFSNYSQYIREDCAKAGCTLADIGTNEGELAALVRKHGRAA